jgi:phosphotransferase system HPr-like phosphotransfer protein
MNLHEYVTEVKVHIEGKEAVEAFVKITGKYDFDIDILDKARHYVIDAKSIMGIFSLDLSKDLIVGTHANGPDVVCLLDDLTEFVVK